MDDAQERQLSSFVGRLLRSSFGKGPESIAVSSHGPFVTIHLRRFLSPAERVLLEQDSEAVVLTTRSLLMQQIIPELRASVSVTVGVHVEDVYYDWDLTNQSGMIILVLTETGGVLTKEMDAYPECRELHSEISAISELVEKVPRSISSCFVNPSTLLVIRDGILVAIEKEMIRSGYETTLRHAKWQLEKRYLHNNSHFLSIFHKPIRDLFVDWNFEIDRSMMVIVLT
ncbi:MAG: Na-translocating system protein MpsC family protein [Firmicutes bacterium]|nr:Na-translocating system protein MpsC family protein [Bacillota bacterium]